MPLHKMWILQVRAVPSHLPCGFVPTLYLPDPSGSGVYSCVFGLLLRRHRGRHERGKVDCLWPLSERWHLGTDRLGSLSSTGEFPSQKSPMIVHSQMGIFWEIGITDLLINMPHYLYKRWWEREHSGSRFAAPVLDTVLSTINVCPLGFICAFLFLVLGGKH